VNPLGWDVPSLVVVVLDFDAPVTMTRLDREDAHLIPDPVNADTVAALPSRMVRKTTTA
jgi:hypothetical protein